MSNVEVARSASAFARRVVSRMSSVHLRVNYELRISVVRGKLNLPKNLFFDPELEEKNDFLESNPP